MTPPPAPPTRPIGALRRGARAALCALALLCTAPAAHAAAAINPYEATVDGEPSGNLKGATIAEALRQVAVRATGRRAAAGDPALAALYGNARQYVQTLTPAGAGQVTVLLEFGGAGIRVLVTDDGDGFDRARQGRGDDGQSLGLPGMAERARLVGGHLRVTSQVGKGTSVEVRVPVSAIDDA